MKSKPFLLFLLILSIIVMGCGCGSKQNIQSGSFPDFQLPKGFHLQNKDATAYYLVNEEETVGEIVKTPLNAEVLSDPDCDEVIYYLETFVSAGMQFEYMMDYSDDGSSPVEIGFNVVDPSTGEEHEYTHFLFENGGECYDLWINNDLVDDSMTCDLLICTGIDPSAE